MTSGGEFGCNLFQLKFLLSELSHDCILVLFLHSNQCYTSPNVGRGDLIINNFYRNSLLCCPEVVLSVGRFLMYKVI